MLLWLTITVIQYLTSVSAFIIPQTKNTTYLFTDSPNYRNRSRLFSNENPDYPGSELVFNKRFLFNPRTTNLSFEDGLSRRVDFFASSQWQTVIMHRIMAIFVAICVVGCFYKILDLFRSFVSSQHRKLKEEESLLLSSHGFEQ
ncbi:hypothetical protein BMR1_02g02821 [Babesia microti strain RI]|uniref:Uncharacterized protein n=1 Tax=Babesia microti (strain RI) TaxID=1133968 RepID=A0A1R4AAL6_BABMR|nr:hypothetical protein BMR1_02g02821 [Babesia microti strain RI]SJK86046.1 hypothetical protein BMR1_02g02821 [Babesia microti strain RI]|eukprot:XP_021338243.1 hypothetical protein BMR1_02g02821 [Babesia microti strain RI]